MKKLAAFLLGLCCCYSPSVFAQESAPRNRVETMFKSFKPGETEGAMVQFAKNSLIKPELVDSLQSQVRIQITASNPVLGYEFVAEQNVGQSIKRLTYIVKTASEPLIWNFSFYRPADTWVPLRITFSGEL